MICTYFEAIRKSSKIFGIAEMYPYMPNSIMLDYDRLIDIIDIVRPSKYLLRPFNVLFVKVRHFCSLQTGCDQSDNTEQKSSSNQHTGDEGYTPFDCQKMVIDYFSTARGYIQHYNIFAQKINLPNCKEIILKDDNSPSSRIIVINDTKVFNYHSITKYEREILAYTNNTHIHSGITRETTTFIFNSHSSIQEITINTNTDIYIQNISRLKNLAKLFIRANNFHMESIQDLKFEKDIYLRDRYH